jgi:hypothetical protein
VCHLPLKEVRARYAERIGKEGGETVPIKWSALKLRQAADNIEALIERAAEPLQQAKVVAQEARQIPELPRYVDQRLIGFILEIERAIGGGRLEPAGRLRGAVASIRESIPAGAIEAEQARLEQGEQQTLM